RKIVRAQPLVVARAKKWRERENLTRPLEIQNEHVRVREETPGQIHGAHAARDEHLRGVELREARVETARHLALGKDDGAPGRGDLAAVRVPAHVEVERMAPRGDEAVRAVAEDDAERRAVSDSREGTIGVAVTRPGVVESHHDDVGPGRREPRRLVYEHPR